MSDFSSMILRFRDLSTPAGTTTIEEHRNIISEKGYVWWGWWNKQGETVPEGPFRKISSETTKSGGYEVFLFDTGKNELHLANLTEIRWDAQLKLIQAPERDATPNYYGDSHYFAWFKLTRIDAANIPENELLQWSYTKIDDLFETNKSVFEAFYNKQISSFKELRNQDRTIWFIRPRRDSDGVHEIHVYDRSKTTPSNFSAEIVQIHTPRILWISDPHFSDDNHDFPRSNELSKFNLSESIRRDLEVQRKINIGGLLISGDLTWRGARSEYEWARKFIDDAMSWAKLTTSQVLVCPGNHDLAFSAEPWTKGTPASELGEASSQEYTQFYENLYEIKPTTHLASGRRFWIPDGMVVDIASLNTSSLQQVADAFQGQGFLGAPQLIEVSDEMKWTQDRGRTKAFRICMLHHHVVPILHREHPDIGTAASVVHDAGALERHPNRLNRSGGFPNRR
jgi:hypothetical protein